VTDTRLASVPTELGWGLIAALLVRGLLAYAPRIVDAVSKALAERATAARLAEQTRLTEAQTEQADHEELRALRGRIDALEKRLREQEDACGQELEVAHALHRATRDRVDEIERQHAVCQSRLTALDAEFRRFRESAASGHTT
jgi:hypothetical protein